VPQDGSNGMSQGVQKHDDGINPGEGAQAMHAPGRQRGQTKQKGADQDVADEKFTKLDGAHWKPAPAFAQDGHGGVIDGQKAGGCFIKSVQREGHA